MISKSSLMNFPLWQFLQQPLFSSNTQLILNPRRFESFYRIQYLERCWVKECGSKNKYFK